MKIMVAADLAEHPKCVRLAMKLRITNPAAAGYLVTFWGWVVRFRESGTLKSLSKTDIALGAKWSGNARKFTNALISCGWIDTKPHLQVHDWQEHVGKLIRDRIADRERKRKERATKSSGNPSDDQKPVHRKSPAHNNNSSTTGPLLPGPDGQSLDDPLLDNVDRIRGEELLLLLGIPKGIAISLACETTIGRIHDIVAIAPTKKNPGGWARDAISKNWVVPKDAGRAALLEDIKSTKREIPPTPSSNLPDRKKGESNDDYLKRMNDELVIRRRESDEH